MWILELKLVPSGGTPGDRGGAVAVVEVPDLHQPHGDATTFCRHAVHILAELLRLAAMSRVPK